MHQRTSSATLHEVGATRHADYNVNIQILRAVSVVLVLLFHVQVPGMAFGYLGVDLFFLISGFLMPIILPKYDASSFLWARISRIYPALIACILVCLTAGYLILIPLEYNGLAWSSITALLSASNIYFYFNAGYFDQDTQTQPLLHTWSLGNEFMCYLMVALALCFTRDSEKLRRISLGIAIAAAAVAGTFLVADGGVSNYFNPFGRIFLFFTAFYVSASASRPNLGLGASLAISGAAIALIALIWGKDIYGSQYPNVSIFLIPLVGLPILTLANPLPLPELARKPAVWVGDVSYSIYIWHWPIITFEKVYLRNFQLNYKEMLLLIGTSLIAATLSYHLIERRRPMRKVALMIPTTALASIIAVGGISTAGFSHRVPPKLAAYSMLENMQDKASTACSVNEAGLTFQTRCHRTAPYDRTLIFAGDSHSRHFQTIIESKEPRTRILQLSTTIHDMPGQIAALHGAATKMGVDRIYVTFHYSAYPPSIGEQLVEKTRHLDDGRIVFVRDVPNFTFDNVACFLQNNSSLMFRSCGFRVADGVPLEKIQNAEEPVWDVIAASGLPVLDTHPLLCSNGKCRQVIDGELIMRDRNHLNERLPRPLQRKLYDGWFAADRGSAPSLPARDVVSDGGIIR